MLQATKANVVTDFHKSTLEVRQMELDYYLMVFDKLSTIAALLAGFASSALMVGTPRSSNPYMVTMFLLSTGSALGSNLLVVIVSTMCVMWGPGHALRGEDASYVDRAVFILDTTKTSMEKFFTFGLICYFTSAILVVWLLFDTRGSSTISAVFLLMILWLYCKVLKIDRNLRPGKMVSGQIKHNRINNVGHLLGDASSTLQGNSMSTSFANRI
mmetsp:Transcript_31112/g.89964  ORF Transcript_31112/g.89964 Transcript_31112/m.89964 type:complete len:214 (-) Transcript_31112:56-697(-)